MMGEKIERIVDKGTCGKCSRLFGFRKSTDMIHGQHAKSIQYCVERRCRDQFLCRKKQGCCWETNLKTDSKLIFDSEVQKIKINQSRFHNVVTGKAKVPKEGMSCSCQM